MPTWPDLDAPLDYDAGWRQRFFEADGLGRCRPVARPVFHRVAEAVFGPDGALHRLAAGSAVAVHLQAGGIGLVLVRADGTPGGERAAGEILAAVLAPGERRPMTGADLWAVAAAAPRRALDPDPAAWPTNAAACCS